MEKEDKKEKINDGKLNILITGGCGYIGSHTALYMKSSELFNPIVLDFNVDQRASLVLMNKKIPIYFGNINDEDTLKKIQTDYNLDGIMHFAAYIEAGESVKDPEKYFENNVTNMEKMLANVKKHTKIKFFIFSSSAAVYGIHENSIKEDFEKKPISPYGESKLKGEKILESFSKEFNLKSICLRYFNAAGCIGDCSIGEDHEPETHLIPKLINFVLDNSPVRVFGNDYPTKDGTCVRDYIHVVDLADGHLKALEYLLKDNSKGYSFDCFNLGSGKGNSVLEVISELQKVGVNTKITIKYEGRREGDPPFLVANTEKAETILLWKRKFGLKEILDTAFSYYNNLRKLRHNY